MKIIRLALITSISLLLQAEEISISQINSNYEDIKKGKTYLKNNNINLAIAAFERVLMYDTENDTAKFYLGKIFAKQKNIKLAKQYFASIKNPTPAMQKEISEFEKKYPERHLRFDIYLKVGAKVDSNINNTTDNEEWSIIENDKKKTIYNNNDKKVGFIVNGLVVFSPVYYLKENRIINTFSVYGKNVLNNSDENIAVFSYMPSFKHKFHNINFQHSFNYNYVRYANESYLDRFELNERIDFNFLKDHTSVSNLSLFMNKYIQDDSNNYYGIAFDTSVTKHLLKNFDIGLKVGIENTIKEKEEAQNVEYTLYKAGINSRLEIFSRELKLSADYNLKKYNDINPYFQEKQTDKKIDLKFSISSKGFFIYQTEIEYINNISNLEPYSYNKWLIGFNIIKTFKGL